MTYTHDENGAIGRLTSAVNGTDTLRWTYDLAGQVLSEQSTRNASVVSYAYDPAGNRISVSLDGQVHVSQLHLERKEPAAVEWSRRIHALARKPGRAGRGHVQVGLVNGKPARMLSGNVFEATLDMVADTNTVTVQATDTNGNTATRNYEVDVSANAATYTYDPNGNLTSKTDGSDTWTYTWSAENQLTKVERNGAEVARFGHDPFGRRVEKVSGAVTTSYTYDGRATLREVRGSTTLKHVQGRAVDEPLAVDDGSSLTYLHTDGLGSIVKQTNASGAVTLTRQHDAWGNIESGGDQSGFAFAGREWDPETDLYYYRARYEGRGTDRAAQPRSRIRVPLDRHRRPAYADDDLDALILPSRCASDSPGRRGLDEPRSGRSCGGAGKGTERAPLPATAQSERPSGTTAAGDREACVSNPGLQRHDACLAAQHGPRQDRGRLQPLRGVRLPGMERGGRQQVQQRPLADDRSCCIGLRQRRPDRERTACGASLSRLRGRYARGPTRRSGSSSTSTSTSRSGPRCVASGAA